MKGNGEKRQRRRKCGSGGVNSVVADHAQYGQSLLSLSSTCPSTATHSSSTRAGPALELAFVKVQSRVPSQHRKREISLASEKTGMRPFPSGISKHRHLTSSSDHFLISRKKNSTNASLFTVAASAIQIECFSSDDDEEDRPQLGVSKHLIDLSSSFV
jgi:hypothetical protein